MFRLIDDGTQSHRGQGIFPDGSKALPGKRIGSIEDETMLLPWEPLLFGSGVGTAAVLVAMAETRRKFEGRELKRLTKRQSRRLK